MSTIITTNKEFLMKSPRTLSFSFLFILALAPSLVFAETNSLTKLRETTKSIYDLINTEKVQADNYSANSAVLAIENGELAKALMHETKSDTEVTESLNTCLMMSYFMNPSISETDKKRIHDLRQAIESLFPSGEISSWVTNYEKINPASTEIVRHDIWPRDLAQDSNNNAEIFNGPFVLEVEKQPVSVVESTMTPWRMPFTISCLVGVKTASGISYVFSALNDY